MSGKVALMRTRVGTFPPEVQPSQPSQPQRVTNGDRMTKPTDTIAAIIELAQAALVGWPAYESTEAALANSLIPAGGGRTRGGDTPDPIAAIAMSHERYYETVATLDETLGHLRHIQRTMAAIRRNHAETHDHIEAAVRAARCDGVIGNDPTCTRNSVRNVAKKEGGATTHPTCWACIQRSYRNTREDTGPGAA